jgi:hypothetical protein
LSSDEGGGGVYEKVLWFETSVFTWSLMLITSAFFISTPVALLVKAYADRTKPKKKNRTVKTGKVHALALMRLQPSVGKVCRRHSLGCR